MRKHALTNKPDRIVYWLIPLFLLGLGVAMGAVWTTHFLHLLQPSLQHIDALAQRILRHGTPVQAIVTVFWNNARVALLMMGLGVFAGVFPMFTMWSNGLMMGVVTEAAAAQAHVPFWKVLLLGELPHGVFELTALCWASSIGIRLAVAAILSLWSLLAPAGTVGPGPLAARSNPSDKRFQRELVHAVERLPFIMAMLLVAACIEITITPHLIELYRH
ncbi:stage II sporulation protein M [Alicyclobacillus cycloheptanicus]|uniref:Stage II sporulation protein M n=1 Tax=Alicyclobacillus cycloheptanicus TaxID=1457 RepID=A0ABT9XKY9_9BACL|nr:stage II sporulation protein M [Alicyclobacillus cycloheptanicus]MDQ0190443.1 stage II sporulation protein M [Alicyclobacillus cycloheptanicus]WDM02682.1 stage II sporulation protein M [Alicyclobacillus cycloheptanicus]